VRENKHVNLADTGECPLCSAAMIIDNRTLVLRRWLITRTYKCGTMLGGAQGSPMYIELECDSTNHKRKVNADLTD